MNSNFPDPRRVVIGTETIAGSELYGWWFNPRTGQATGLGTLRNEKRIPFTPPTIGPGEDWVLVLDDAARQYPVPGTRFRG